MKEGSIGAANPYALAELVAGRRIDWDRENEPRKVMEEILGRPYDELIDPRYDSPLYAGFAYEPRRGFRRLPAIEVADLEEPAGTVSGSRLITNRVLPHHVRQWMLGPEPRRFEPGGSEQEGSAVSGSEWTPTGYTWADAGRYFNEVPELTDPCQRGSNCYFVAALSAVAWTNPEVIVHSTKPSGPANQDFVCLIKLHQAPDKPLGSKNQATATVQVSEKLLVTSSGDVAYCHSMESNEIWPGVYEKAYAKWLTRNTTDKPDITATWNGSVPWRAVMQITGWQNLGKHSPRSMTNEDLWSFVMAETNGGSDANFGATRYPMVAATVDSASETVDGTAFNGDVVANHAYTVVGLATIGGERHIVLRNPWGNNHPSAMTGAAAGKVWNARVYSTWTQQVWLDRLGVFTISLDAFRNYYETIAVVKP